MSRHGALAFVFASLLAMPAYAQTCVGSLFAPNYAGTIAIVTSDPNITSSIDGAIGKWQTCWQMGSSYIPALQDSGSADLSFSVIHVSGNSTSATGGCAQIAATVFNNRVTGGVITVWDAQSNGVDCEPFRDVSIAHEIGHALGLSDSSCNGYIMGPPSGTPNDVPQSDECAKVDDQWITPYEVTSSCYEECRGTCDDQGNCTDQTPSPIIIDVAGLGYHLTSVANGVRFDLDADGFMEDVSWTRAGDAGNAFLCLDINVNGTIDSGRELFGNYSVLPDGSRPKNGFVALAAYDSPRFGGNANGWIDSNDAIWPRLRLWVDINHDGISQPNELMTLDAAGIVRISTRYDTDRRRDEFGNLFRYRGTCLVFDDKGNERYRNLYDVFLRAR